MKLFELTKIPIINKALDAYSLRQRVTANNLANVNTLGYRTKAVTFEEELGKVENSSSVTMEVTNEHHLLPNNGMTTGDEIKVVDAAKEGIVPDDPNASGMNNVDVDYEMTNLADTQLRFKFASRMMAETFKSIQKSIRGQS
ncbi:MAG TPA: flagellar basal body rod protein FlgB [Bacteroidota bacterium]|nr:flagellar basal body rod protein FlgB [Bacteroidota bacterium]